MFRIDIGAGAAGLLGLGADLQGQGGLARAFRAVDFDDAPARQATDAQRDVQTERTRWNDFGFDRLFAAARAA